MAGIRSMECECWNAAMGCPIPAWAAPRRGGRAARSPRGVLQARRFRRVRGPESYGPHLRSATGARPRPYGDRVGAMEHSEQPTKRAPQGSGWSIDDAVVRLRLWATESAHRSEER